MLQEEVKLEETIQIISLEKVLATSINLDCDRNRCERDDDVIDLKSEGYDRIIVSLSSFDPSKAEKGTSQALIQGVASKLKEEGYKIGGFEAYVTSDVLNGAGMSFFCCI